MIVTIQKNPALELKFFINEFRKITANRPHAAAISNWSSALDANDTTIFEKLVALQKLVLNVEAGIQHDPELLLKERYLSCIAPIKQSLLSEQLQQQSHTFANSVFAEQGSTMMALDFCSERLSKTKPETQITKEILQELKAEGQELLSEVADSVEDPLLRQYLAELLQCFSFGIDSYSISGVSSIEDSLDLVLGRLTRQKEKFKSASEKDQSVIAKISMYFHKSGQVADDAKKIAGLGRLGYEAFKQIST